MPTIDTHPSGPHAAAGCHEALPLSGALQPVRSGRGTGLRAHPLGGFTCAGLMHSLSFNSKQSRLTAVCAQHPAGCGHWQASQWQQRQHRGSQGAPCRQRGTALVPCQSRRHTWQLCEEGFVFVSGPLAGRHGLLRTADVQRSASTSDESTNTAGAISCCRLTSKTTAWCRPSGRVWWTAAASLPWEMSRACRWACDKGGYTEAGPTLAEASKHCQTSQAQRFHCCQAVYSIHHITGR